MASQADESPAAHSVAPPLSAQPVDDQAQAGASEHDHETAPIVAAAAAPEASSSPTPAKPTTPDLSPDPTSLSPPHAPLNRSETAELALGPDGQPALPLDSSTPALRMTLMLTTGARHAYTISQKYLASRKVEAVDSEGRWDPREMSGYKLKELIWTDWRPEWEPRPRDPSAIRLIIMGRMMDDKVALKDLPFNLSATNVVHMTIKPADLMDDEAEGAGKHGGKGSIRQQANGEESGAGCRCVIL